MISVKEFSEKKFLITLKPNSSLEGANSFREWKEYRIFVKFKVTNKSNEDFDLSFTSRGRNIVIGEFLNLEDKISLKNKIKNIIFELNSKAGTSI